MNSNQHYKQVIVVRRDLNMSPGKLAAQVSHASMAFLTNLLKQNAYRKDAASVVSTVTFDYDMWEGWINGIFTKVVLYVKSKTAMENLIKRAEDNGMHEGTDFFCIRDACLTELTPEEPDGTCLTCIGFRPMIDEKINPVTKKLQLLK